MFGISFAHILLLVLIIYLIRRRSIPGISRDLKKSFQSFKDGWDGTPDAEYRHLPDPDLKNSKASKDAAETNKAD